MDIISLGALYWAVESEYLPDGAWRVIADAWLIDAADDELEWLAEVSLARERPLGPLYHAYSRRLYTTEGNSLAWTRQIHTLHRRYRLGFLFLRYERGDFSLIEFIRQAGHLADVGQAKPFEPEDFYALWTALEQGRSPAEVEAELHEALAEEVLAARRGAAILNKILQPG